MYAEHGTGEKELYDLKNDPFELAAATTTPPTPRSRRSSRPRCTSSKTAPVRAAASIGPTLEPELARAGR